MSFLLIAFSYLLCFNASMRKETNYYGSEKISKILFEIAPPVMLSQLIQALYNIVDSLFVGQYSSNGLTALSIIYPLQLLMIALSVGTGVGMNTSMARYLGAKNKQRAQAVAGLGIPLALLLWLFCAIVAFFGMPFYAQSSTQNPEIIKDVIIYGRIIVVFGFGLFLESIFSKILQAYGDMKTPMFAQIIGALINIVLDPILIFGWQTIPSLGIAGAAIATVIGQIVTAILVGLKAYTKPCSLKKNTLEMKRIYKLGIPNILMQSAYTFYILGLNLILSTFSDQAVTALGLFYKWQTFFFIPLSALQTCIVPIVSYNYAANQIQRCKKALHLALIIGLVLMGAGSLCFEFLPHTMLAFFSSDPKVIRIGTYGFRWIGLSFFPMVTSLIFPVFFQSIGYAIKSSFLTILRTVILFVPLGYLFAQFSLHAFWLTFPITETLTSIVGVFFYLKFRQKMRSRL